MFARSTTIHGRPEAVDQAIGLIRDEIMPQVSTMDGFRGYSMMVDRSSGRCIVTAAWESEEAMRASAEAVGRVRDSAAQQLGSTYEVQEWEVATMHRAHHAREGSCVRSTWTRVDPQNADRAVDLFRMGALPAVQQLEGFCSASLFVDRANGLAVSNIAYDTAEALDRTREQASAIRQAAVSEMGAEVLEIAEFELVLAHLHVPEMA